jgi:MFS family permease
MQPVPNPEELVETEPLTPVPHDPYAAWRYRDCGLYLIGSLFAAIGMNMQAVAVGWEAYERTGKAMTLGWVGLVQALPVVLFALPAGQLADRFDRRRILIWGLLFAALASAGLAHWSFTRGPVSMLYWLLFLFSVARALLWPASSALMPLLVPRDAFSNAVTWKSTTFQIASVGGPALGGLLIALYKAAGVVYVAAAGCSMLYLVSILMLRWRGAPRSAEPMSVKSVLAGLGFVRRTKVVLAAITLDLFAVLLGGATALLPIYAKDILHVGPSGLGWLRAAPAVGAFMMALVLAHRPPFKRAGPVLLWAVTGFGLTMIGFGLSKSFGFSMVMLVLSGALDNISVVVRHSLVQLSTPDELRGRVSAVNTVFISCSNELGEFESGTVAAWLGPIFSVVSGGVGTIVVVLTAMKLWPEIRKLRSLQDAAS